MSAQRRTVKEKSPAADTPRAVANRPKERVVTDRVKAPAAKQPSILATRLDATRKLFRDSWSEIQKVNWPDNETLRNLTIVVIGISTVLGLLLGGIDFLLEKLFQVMS
jgi:preprotein translocase subunit SecE